MEVESKLTARIDAKSYAKVKGYFYHGQQTQFFRKIFASLEKLIDSGQDEKITDYMYNGADLTLPSTKD